MTTSKIQMDQIRSTSATVTGENIRAGSQKKSSLSPAEGLQGASPDATCTCPSGDGSLRHPCPAHPAPVERVGTNVGHGHVFPRADGVKMRCGGPGLCSECAADASRARAALAQPSPAQAECIDCHGSGFCMSISNEEIRCPCGAPIKFSGPAQAEQAEAERPVVIARLYRSNDLTMTPFAEVQKPLPMPRSDGTLTVEPLMTVAQHERIDPEQGGVDQAGGDRWDALQSIMEWTAAENIPDDRKLCLIRNAARAALAQPSPAQAEAEQPEIVAFRYRCTNAEGEPLPGWFYSDGAGTLGLREPLMAVSQHERIIGQLHDALDESDGDRWKLRSERDA
ncbi:hypothetical protein FA204_03090, partial [Pseudomonas aeruginosa]|nr:hypothetical protein [Pseudomonas aeruginosa]